MNIFKPTKYIDYYILIIFLILFFIIETYSQNELLLTLLVIVFSLISFVFPNDRKVKILLWCIGTILGFIIEVGMGFVTRSQFWSYGSFFGVPLWLPFIWGFGFIAIYLLGQFIKSKT